jgi:predicted ATPase
MGASRGRLIADVIGETPNLAARLQGLAGPNQVVISGSTAALVQGFVTLDSLGTPPLKGVDRPVPVYAVAGETTARSRLDASSQRGLTPLVGRDAELGVLLQAWGAARRGTGGLVFVSGEPGIGKSRLVHELRQQVVADGGAVVELRGLPRFQHSVLQPLVEHLRRATGVTEGLDGAEAWGRIDAFVGRSADPPPGAAEVVAELLGIDAAPLRQLVPLEPEARKRRTLDVITKMLLHLASAQPTLLICEDLQWIDPTTTELMGAIVERDPPPGLFTVITHRSDQLVPWTESPGAPQIALGRLLTPEVDRIVAQLSRDRELPDDLQREIAERTDGVPLFVEELTHMLLDAPPHPELRVARVERSVPSTLRELLMARLDRQGSAAEVAQLAATVGREVSRHFLRRIWRGDEATLDAELERLVGSGLMHQQGDGGAARFTFKHALVQDVAYDSLLKSARQAHHRAIAEALAEQAREPVTATPEVIAHHYSAAGMPAQAVPHWLLAGERALDRSAHHEAIAHLSAALDLLAQLPETRARDEQELMLLVRLGAPLMATRGYGSAEVEDVYRRALILGDGLGDITQLFEALYGIFRMHLLRGDYFVALDVADRLVALAAREDRPELTVAASRAVGSALVYYGDDKSEALRALHHAIATDAAHRDPHRKGPALNDVADAAITSQAYAAWALWLRGQTPEANLMADTAVERARALGHPFTLALALSFDAVLRQFQHDVAAVRERADEAWTFVAEQGFTFWVGWVAIMRGWATAAEGDAVDGAAQIRRGLVDWQATGSQLGTTYFLSLLAEVLLSAGETVDALEILDEATTLAHEKGEAFWLAEVHRLHAEVLVSLGDWPGAEVRAAEAAQVASRQGAAELLTRVRATQARVASRAAGEAQSRP